MTSLTPFDLTVAINKSGYPLQLGIETLVESLPTWKATLVEHPWLDPETGSPNFLDLVITQNTNSSVRFVIECKKTRETIYLFLRDRGTVDQPPITDVRCRFVSWSQHQEANVNRWIDCEFIPGSPQANFCVVNKSGENNKNRELIEPICRELVRATDALVEQEMAWNNRKQDPISRIYIPLVVTTAKIYICDGDYRALDLDSGELPSAEIEEVSFVRYRKSLALTQPAHFASPKFEHWAKENDRSVMIVQASKLAEFLGKWQLGRVPAWMKGMLHAEC